MLRHLRADRQRARLSLRGWDNSSWAAAVLVTQTAQAGERVQAALTPRNVAW